MQINQFLRLTLYEIFHLTGDYFFGIQLVITVDSLIFMTI